MFLDREQSAKDIYLDLYLSRRLDPVRFEEAGTNSFGP